MMEKINRRAAILLLLSAAPSAASAQVNERVINLDGFSLTLRFGTSVMTFSAEEIWSALHPINPSNLL